MLAPFARPRVFLPVIHLPHGEAGAFQSVEIALSSGADGVFLIDQGMSDRELLLLLPKLKERHPHLWLGVNLLGYDPPEILSMPEISLIDGIWSDDAGVDSLDARKAAQAAERFRAARASSGWRGLYFGGTAFKTQAPIPYDRLPEVARTAAGAMDVVTTSGRGTGVAIDPEKVKIMREAIGTHPLAVASGVTPENVHSVLPYVDAYLVATGIERSFGRLDEGRTRALAEIIHG